MAKNTEAVGDIFDEKNEVKPQSINWGKVGDFVEGTKIGQRKSQTKFGENTVYEMIVDRGSFHATNGDKVDLNKGEVWSFWGRNEIFDAQVSRMQIGQRFGLKFVESKPSKMGNDAKIIKVFTAGAMNTEYLEANQGMEGGYQVQ